MKKCPYCAEEIKPDAVKCRYCGEWLNQQTAPQTVSSVKSKDSDSLNFSDKKLTRWETMPLGKKGFLFFVFLWEKMSFGKKVLTSFLIFLFVIGLLGILKPGINDNNRQVSQEQSVKEQTVQIEKEQAAQTQAKVEAQEAESRLLLFRCTTSCSSLGKMLSHNSNYTEKIDEEDSCKNKCEQEALTRNIEISKLREMQNQHRQ